jgi:hypothetical protein
MAHRSKGRVRRSVVPGLPGKGLGVDLRPQPGKKFCSETVEEAKAVS